MLAPGVQPRVKVCHLLGCESNKQDMPESDHCLAERLWPPKKPVKIGGLVESHTVHFSTTLAYNDWSF